MRNYRIVEGKIEVDDWFVAFGVIGKCTEVDKTYDQNEPNYNSKETKWTCGKHCKKIEFID
jgi:hypothetical protein